MTAFKVVTEELMATADAIYGVANAASRLRPSGSVNGVLEAMEGSTTASDATACAQAATDKIFALYQSILLLGDEIVASAMNYEASDQGFYEM